MKKWFVELLIDDELSARIKKFIDLTGQDDEVMVLNAIKEYIESRLKD